MKDAARVKQPSGDQPSQDYTTTERSATTDHSQYEPSTAAYTLYGKGEHSAGEQSPYERTDDDGYSYSEAGEGESTSHEGEGEVESAGDGSYSDGDDYSEGPRTRSWLEQQDRLPARPESRPALYTARAGGTAAVLAVLAAAAAAAAVTGAAAEAAEVAAAVVVVIVVVVAAGSPALLRAVRTGATAPRTAAALRHCSDLVARARRAQGGAHRADGRGRGDGGHMH
eukprot:scaffold4172_cov39-Phaeocystis_antarctica.AAC.1